MTLISGCMHDMKKEIGPSYYTVDPRLSGHLSASLGKWKVQSTLANST